MKELLILWLVAAMNFMAPAHRQHFLPEARESYDQADARYREIATGIIEVAFDPQEKPLFGGKYGRSHTALFLAHKMYHESGFRRDVQYGYGREKYAGTGLNDFGRSWCLGQIMLGQKLVQVGVGKWEYNSAQKTDEGYTGRDLLADINKCVRATLHILHKSFNACGHLPQDERMAAYAAGTCASERGRQISRDRFRSFRARLNQVWKSHPKKTDVEVLAPPALVETAAR